MTVADRIKKRRMDLEMSQAELAERAKYSDKTRVSKLENAGDDISMKQIKRVATALRTTPEYLMGWTDNPNESDIPILQDYHMAKVEANFMPIPHKKKLAVEVQKHDLITSDRVLVELAEAKRLYDLYSQAPPEIQAAVETLLKATKSDNENPHQ